MSEIPHEFDVLPFEGRKLSARERMSLVESAVEEFSETCPPEELDAAIVKQEGNCLVVVSRNPDGTITLQECTIDGGAVFGLKVPTS